MRKVARLREVERTWGPEFVLPYIVCHNETEMGNAVARFEFAGRGWGVRTDWADGADQGFHLPFLFSPTWCEARDLARKHGDRLVYIVSENVRKVLLHGVGILVEDDPGHVFFEINDKEPDIAQRGMYRNPENLRRFVVGHAGRSVWNGTVWRSFEPEDVHPLGLDAVWRKMVELKAQEATFTVLPGHKVVVW